MLLPCPGLMPLGTPERAVGLWQVILHIPHSLLQGPLIPWPLGLIFAPRKPPSTVGTFGRNQCIHGSSISLLSPSTHVMLTPSMASPPLWAILKAHNTED